jgi:hypothetical protein
LVKTDHLLSFSKETNKFLIFWFQGSLRFCLRLFSTQDNSMEINAFCTTRSSATTFTLLENRLIYVLSPHPNPYTSWNTTSDFSFISFSFLFSLLISSLPPPSTSLSVSTPAKPPILAGEGTNLGQLTKI